MSPPQFSNDWEQPRTRIPIQAPVRRSASEIFNAFEKEPPNMGGLGLGLAITKRWPAPADDTRKVPA